MGRHQRHNDVTYLPYFAIKCFLPINDRLLLIMTENDVNPPINNDPMEKKKRIYRLPLVQWEEWKLAIFAASLQVFRFIFFYRNVS